MCFADGAQWMDPGALVPFFGWTTTFLPKNRGKVLEYCISLLVRVGAHKLSTLEILITPTH